MRNVENIRQALKVLATGEGNRDAALLTILDIVNDTIITDDTRSDAGRVDADGDEIELTLEMWLSEFDFSGFGGETDQDTIEQIYGIAQYWDNDAIDAEGYAPQMIALARFLECKISDLTDEGDGRYREGRCEYLVGTDEEMEISYDEYLDSYIEECILPEIPEAYQSYFDKEKWKSDAASERAGALASYDGNENGYEIDGVMYFIYRTN